MRRRIFQSIMLTSFIVLAITTALIMGTVYNEFSEERKEEIAVEASYIAKGYYDETMEYLQEIGEDSKNRITLIQADGTVLYDSLAGEATMDNHIDREEVADALQYGSGEATRNSDTLREETYYYALRLEDGNVIRVAAPVKSLVNIIDRTANVIFLILLFALGLAVITAHLLTKSVVKPINKLDLDVPLSNPVYDELAPLLVRMEKQNQKIAEQMASLRASQNDFNEITSAMSEALVIYGTDKHVLSLNRSAKQLFSDFNAEGIGYLELYHDLEYIRAVESAFAGKPAGGRLVKHNRIYQFSVNPVTSGSDYAAVLFAIDVTERENAEQLRREFTANVSHELKTPLTTIMGCAEIMQNGIAKQEDYVELSRNVFHEAKRLLTLIEDIIKLSQLDEGGLKEQFSDVDLYALAERVMSELSHKAKEAKVELSLVGESAVISGIESTLHEMLYNLCDNAITYNRAGGTVKLRITEEDGHTVFAVADTGIGIGSEHRERIFERFYRVDKSRSKAKGGTGLGLSIVKHGALIHGAKIRLESVLDEGTTISLVF